MQIKYYIHGTTDNWQVSGSFPPPDIICEAPKDLNGNYVEDKALISLVDQVDPITGRSQWVAIIDPAKVAIREANNLVKAKQAEVAKKYILMNEEILTEMYNTFGTTNPDSANAYKQTWELMKSKPSIFRDEGLLVERQILAADGMTILFEAGAALNDDFSVVTYATRLIQMAEEYAVYRMKRIQQFRDDRAIIIAS